MNNQMQVKLRGTAPLLMHSCKGVDPLNPITMDLKKYTSKRGKTEEDNLTIARLEYESAMYFDPEVGPYVPANNLQATLRDAGKKRKLGTKVNQGIFVFPDNLPLIYDGPRTIQELWDDYRFRDSRVVGVNGSSVIRTRPRFDNWALEFILDYDTDLFDEDTILDILRIAGNYIGLCDYRPRYGKFGFEVNS
jgi:hypothetical protein